MDLFFPPNFVLPLLHFQRLVVPLCGSLFGLYFVFHWSICSFFHQNHTILITVLYPKSQSQVVSVFQLCFFLLQFCVGYSGSFASPYKLWNHFNNIHQMTCLTFNWDFIESADQVEKNWSLAILSLLWTWSTSAFIQVFFDFFHQNFVVFLSWSGAYFIMLNI